VAQQEPGLEHDWTSLERRENLTWQSLKGSAEKNGRNSQIQVCQSCSIIPKKTRCCNHCQTRLDAVITAKGASTKFWVKGLKTYVNVILQFICNILAKVSKNMF
jgi:uncharacterized paraquat-inducible protein A